MAQTINENLRMTWGASIVAVHSAREAIVIAKAHGLTWFNLEEWNATREAFAGVHLVVAMKNLVEAA